MIEFLRKHRSRLFTAGLWLLVLLPVIGAILLTRTNAVDQRFLDDWELAKYVIKFKEGTLAWGDLGAVYMEHRPVLPRVLTIAATILWRGDVRGLNVLTILFLLGGFAAITRLLMKHGGLTIREAWLPLLVAAVTLFTPAQWQTLLWGDCFYAVMPGMFLALALCVAFAKWKWWLRCIIGTVLATLATLSFASGILVWMLPLPVMLVCGAFGGSRDRIKFTMLWFAIMTVVFGIYAQVRIQPHDSVKGEKIILPLPGGYDVTYNLVNEVDRQFAYGQGKENVMARNLPYFLEHPAEDFEFVRVFSGVLLMRGAPGDTLIAAKWAGTVLLGGLAALAYFCWRWRKDRALFPLLFALLCLGAYTPVTGVLVAMGRIWAGHSYTALNVRYHAHHPQIIIALTCAAAFILRHRAKQRAVSSDTTETSRSIGNDTSAIACSWVCAGALFTILGMGWLYGTNMMDAWRGARLRNAAAQMFSQVLPKHSWFASWVSGTFEKTHDMSAALEQHGLLLTPLLHDTVIHQGRLGHLYVSPTTLTQNRAFGNRLWKENNDWLCEGYASLPLSDRPADAILFAYRVPGAEWTVWGFTQGDGPPHYLPGAMGKDLWGILPRDHQWPAAFMNGWHQNLSVISEPPPGAQISVWAVDMYRRQLMRIVRKRKDSPDMDGEILETLSTRRVPVDEKKSEEEE